MSAPHEMPARASEPHAGGYARLFEAVRRAEDAMPGGADLARAHARLLETLAGGAPRRPIVRAWAAGWAPKLTVAAVALAALLVLLLLRPALDPPGATRAALGVGAVLEPGLSTFSDGTKVLVGEASRARLEAIDASGARVRLEQGRLEADVAHRDGARWHFLGGPFDVLVTGTRFEVAWDPRSGRMHLAMREGSVVVTGPGLGEGHAVVAGQVLDADAVVPAEVGSVSAPSAASSAAREPAPAREPATRGASTWRDLAHAGRYGDALAAAERAGFAEESARGDVADLLLLGDVARLAGAEGRAREAYLTLRRRFPRDARTSKAAFMLGRLALERAHSADEAARWFEVSLREQPSGALARDALGRLIEAQKLAGNVAAARDAARRYLAAFPGGPHAARARDVLQGE